MSKRDGKVGRVLALGLMESGIKPQRPIQPLMSISSESRLWPKNQNIKINK